MHTGWKTEREFRDWEYEMEEKRRDAVRGLYKVRRPSGWQLTRTFLVVATVALVLWWLFGFIANF